MTAVQERDLIVDVVEPRAIGAVSGDIVRCGPAGAAGHPQW